MKILFALSIISLTVPVLACGGSPHETSRRSSSNALSGDYCEAPTDCNGLLPRSMLACADGTFAGAQWDCIQNACTISYCDDNGGPASDSSSSGGGGGAGSCQSPGDCTGLLPRTSELCADGTSAGAQWDCVQGQCTISYCDDDDGTAGSNTCQQPTDCTGSLPSTVEFCADGTSASAQWDCVQGQCTVSYCDDDGGTAAACNDFNPCPSGQVCINQQTGQPAVNGQGGLCQAN